MELECIDDEYAAACRGSVRNVRSGVGEVNSALYGAGVAVGQRIAARFCAVKSEIVTPMGRIVSTPEFRREENVVVTTSADAEGFGAGLRACMPCCVAGSMSFSGRGSDVLRGPVRSLELPVRVGAVNVLVVAKSVLATGCTAIGLTRSAMAEVRAKHLVIAAVFYSVRAVEELFREFPHAIVYVIGDADEVGADGMLRPGVGDLDERQALASG